MSERHSERHEKKHHDKHHHDKHHDKHDKHDKHHDKHDKHDKGEKTPRSRKKRESVASKREMMDKYDKSGDRRKSDEFRHKKTSKQVVTTILRPPEALSSDAPARTRDQTAQLEQQSAPGDIATLLDSYYQPYGSTIYANLNSIVRAARSINTHTAETEYIFVGWKGDGKSSLIEAILGLPLQGGVATMRPIHFHVNQNSKLKAPRFALGLSTGIKHTTLEELPAELKRLNSDFTTSPVHVLIEKPSCVNFVLIDTPGIGGSDGVAKKAENLVRSLASPERRYVFVEAAPARWEPSALRSLASELDPLGSRTTFAYTMAHIQLRNFMTHEQAIKYIDSRPVKNSFLVAGLSKETRDAISTPAEFSKRVVQADLRVNSLCDSLGVSKEGAGNVVGLRPLLTGIYEQGIKDLEHQMPVIMEQIRTQREKHERELAQVNAEKDALQPNLLRASASRWAGGLGRSLVALMHGTAAGQPSSNGQTLPEELASAEVFAHRWATAPGDFIEVPVEDVPNANVKLYGVQQLQRLAEEFRVAAQSVEFGEKSINKADLDVGDASHPNSSYQRQLAAADIASRRAIQLFGPLITQLFGRGVAIVERLFGIAVNLANRSQQTCVLSADAVPFDVKHFPFLLFRVRDLVQQRVAQLAAIAQSKALDDLQCFYFEKTPKDDSDVSKLAAQLFEQMRKLTLTNVILKFQCFFVNRCASELATAAHGSLAQIPDTQIDSLFQTKEYEKKLKARASSLKVALRRVDNSRDMLQSRKVAAADPTIRKSFIVPRKSAKKKKRSALASKAKAKEESDSEEEPVAAATAASESDSEEVVQKPPPPTKAPPPPAAEYSDDDSSEEDRRLEALRAKRKALERAAELSDSDDGVTAPDNLSDVSDGSIDDAEVAAALEGDYSSED